MELERILFRGFVSQAKRLDVSREGIFGIGFYERNPTTLWWSSGSERIPRSESPETQRIHPVRRFERIGVPRFIARREIDSYGDGAGRGSRTIQVGTERLSSRRVPFEGQRSISQGRTASISTEDSMIPHPDAGLARRRH